MEKPEPVAPPTLTQDQLLARYIKGLRKLQQPQRRNTLAMDVISTLCMVVVALGVLCFTYLYINHSAQCSTEIPMSALNVWDTIMFTECELPLMEADLINPQSWTNPSIPDA